MGKDRLMMAVAVAIALSGCSRAKAPSPRPQGLWSLAVVQESPAPTVAETGGDSTSWYFGFVLDGGYALSTCQVLVVTTNSRLDASRIPKPHYADPAFTNWREIYWVPQRVAEKIDDMLSEHRFFGWKSAVNGGDDIYQWHVAVANSQGRHAVLIDQFMDFFGDRQVASVGEVYTLPAPRALDSADSEAMSLSKKAFNLIDEVREVAKEGGIEIDEAPGR